MHQLILCTCPDQKTADTIASRLVADKLAACVNILPGLTSIYEWQGEIETAQEQLLLIKSHRDRFVEIESTIKQTHPYEVPEIVAIDIVRGSSDYLKWIDTCLRLN